MSIWVVLLLVAITGAIHDAYSAESEDESDEVVQSPPPPPHPGGVERRQWRTPPIPSDVQLILFCRAEWDLPRTAIRGTEGWLVSGDPHAVSEFAQGVFWMPCPKPPST